MSLETQIEALVEALQTNTAATLAANVIRERMVAGQQAALEKLAEKADGATPRKPRTPKAEAGNSQEHAGTGSDSTGAGTATNEPEKLSTHQEFKALLGTVKTEDDLKAHVMTTWTGGTTDPEEKKRRIGVLQGIAKHLDVAPQFGTLQPHREKVLFFIERAKLGLEVNFAAPYDFAGDPAQDEPAAASESDFG